MLTFRAGHTSWLRGGYRFAIAAKLARAAAFGVFGTRQKVAKAPFTHHHRATAYIAGDIRHYGELAIIGTPFERDVPVFVATKIARKLTFGVAVAAHKFTLAPKAYNQHAAIAFGARQAGTHIHTGTRIGYNRCIKRIIKRAHHGHPWRIAFGNGIEAFFEVRGEFIVDDIGKIIDQQIIDGTAKHRRHKTLVL